MTSLVEVVCDNHRPSVVLGRVEVPPDVPRWEFIHSLQRVLHVHTLYPCDCNSRSYLRVRIPVVAEEPTPAPDDLED